MYIGRTINELQQVACQAWTIEELAYHHDTMMRFQNFLTEEGFRILQNVQAELDARGGIPSPGGYGATSIARYD